MHAKCITGTHTTHLTCMHVISDQTIYTQGYFVYNIIGYKKYPLSVAVAPKRVLKVRLSPINTSNTPVRVGAAPSGSS